MKLLIIATLLNMPSKKGSIRDIKLHLLELYPSSFSADKSKQLTEWEITLVKTLSRYKNIFLKAGAVYKMDS